ncbi:MAG: CRTAC1 family protein, partial [Planctomycetes bacterium]|nr:CRTAC1 family protein [Planctomycetota bacterium]
DLDNDGDLDVFVGNHGPDALYLNDGHGHFENVTSRAGIAGNDWSTSVAMLDYDLDGWLDIFVVHYLVEDPERNCIVAGRTDYCGPAVFPGRADRLWRNLGDGRFEDVSESTGIARIVAHGLGVVIEDFNGDGWPDLYVANDQDANQLWMNTKKGGFRDDALVFGAAFNGMGAVEASMGVTAGDVDGDGYIDLFMTHFAGQTNTLYRGSADGVFGDDSSSSGLGTPSLAYTGFGTQFGDLDNDGDLDLAVVNGRVVRAEKPIEADDEFVSNYAEPAQLFENVRGKFFDLGGKAGEFASQPGVGRSLALVDVDGDGGLDVFVTRCRGPLRFYRNVHPARGHWLCVRAFDPALNRDAYGALITLVTASGQQARRVSPAVSYQTSGTIDLHFGMGEATEYSALLVQWPGGATERFPGGPADRTVLLRRGEGR